ncbi:hypothetical protein [Fictibacillus sp. 26RED30]|uniref:hypothetical protein n=1 Tax=Fictibacillus sp. 26RED30 TaxID=2745877 RepID=UPI0018CE1D33|nr:hypothetical protein [Fictibacillus sp. 26RED30]MBH0159639.1 hypothetical protein [Fictibacillus sp. 26RED30]
MRIKLFYFFLFFLVLGLLSLEVVGSIKFQYSEARGNLIEQLEISKFSKEDIAGIEASIQDINEKYLTFESISFIKDGETNAQIQNHRNILNEAFTVTEKFEIGDYTIIHRYNPDWYFLFPLVFLSISGILLIVWLIVQGKKLYRMSHFLLH